MKHEFISTKPGNQRLILIFSGWGSHPTMFQGLSKPGYDILVVWDYTEETPLPSQVNTYSEIVLIAWSMGVYESQRLLADAKLPFTAKIAVNGTLWPRHNTLGISEAVFDATLERLDARTLLKFYMRMCGGTRAMSANPSYLPARDLDDQLAELQAIAKRLPEDADRWNEKIPDDIPPWLWRQMNHPPLAQQWWSQAVIGTRDLIFPVDNQRAAWKKVPQLELEIPHLPDWQSLIDRVVVDKLLVAERFDAAREDYAKLAEVQERVAKRLVWAWAQNWHEDYIESADEEKQAARYFPHILEIGTGTGFLTREIRSFFRHDALELWDLCPISIPLEENETARVGDAEVMIKGLPDNSIDMIASASTVQWFNSLPTFLEECWRVLKPGGYLLLSTFGPRTFEELRNLGVDLPQYPDYKDICDMIGPEWMIDYLEPKIMRVEKRNAQEVLDYMRRLGVNCVNRKPLDVAQMRKIIEEYPQPPFCHITYQPIYISLIKPKQ
ncbi:MAG: DUF452 family protein [Bacteroidales bacterium]|nr:DUF452 family protein [Bacteroidales bacterium]